MNRKTMSLAALVLAAVLFVAVNVLSGTALRGARLDLTEDGLYTLSPGTLNVIAGIQEPVTLRLYWSERLANDLPALRVYGTRVRELLEEYAARSAGKIRLEVIDPEPFSDEEDRAVAAGLEGAPVDRASGRAFYFGLIGTNTVDKREVIPFFPQERERFLEYDLTRLVHALADPKKPVVGLLTDMPLEYGPGGIMAAMRGGSQPYALLASLRAFFEVRMIPTDAASIDPDVSVLVVARPMGLSDWTLYAIDQHVMRGGRAVFFVDPFAESAVDPATGRADPIQPRTAALPRLFDAWGIAMDSERFVADPALALEVNAGEGGRRRVTPYVPWLAIDDAHRDASDVVTAQLGVVNVASAGAVSVKEGASVALTPLMTSSAAAHLLPVVDLQGRPEPEKLLGAAQGPGEPRVIAARVSGALKSAFPDGPPPPPEAKEGEAQPPVPLSEPHLKETAEPANLIVVADSDLLEDRFWVETQSLMGQRFTVPFAGNGDFVVNAVENLGGSGDLIGLRGRAGAARPFIVVQDLRRAAGQQMLAREQELTQQLTETERRIAELQTKAKSGGGALLPAEEQEAIDSFRAEVLRIRKELRDVQHALNRDIESLATAVKAVNIVAAPLAVALAAVALAAFRRRTRKARV